MSDAEKNSRNILALVSTHVARTRGEKGGHIDSEDLVDESWNLTKKIISHLDGIKDENSLEFSPETEHLIEDKIFKCISIEDEASIFEIRGRSGNREYARIHNFVSPSIITEGSKVFMVLDDANSIHFIHLEDI